MKIYQECIDFLLLKLKIENEPYLIEIVRFCAAFQSSATKWVGFFCISPQIMCIEYVLKPHSFFYLFIKGHSIFLIWFIQMLSRYIHFFFAINLIKHKKKIIFQIFLEVYGCMVYHCSARHSRAPINVIFINKFLP